MLFMSPDASQLMRLQGCFVSDPELERLIGYWKSAGSEQSQETSAPARVREFVQSALPSLQQMQEPKREALPGQGDEMIDKAIQVIRREGKASVTLLQRRLRIGYARAARIIEALEEQGVVGPDQGGSRGRQVLVTEDG
jgi:S-DNA-T family DNA segregation ATPase FtsK/SpoIIIE